MEKTERKVSISRASNALMLQLGVWENGSFKDYGQPYAVLDKSTDEDLGRIVRNMFAIRIRKKAEIDDAGTTA